MPTEILETPDGYKLNADNDSPDSRDHFYQPSLIQLKSVVEPDHVSLKILDQGKEGACTGFGLAAVINMLNQKRESDIRVSARMLYNMAKKFDRWPGEAYSGSSCRGAIQGWKSMGACSDELWPYRSDDRSYLTIERAKNARNNTVGAYYRLKHNIADFHAALNETGVIYVSANVHSGWWPRNLRGGRIPFRTPSQGGHAFAVVGYNEAGFLVQNSWGPGWGKNGLAFWSYEDWQANIKDAWVVRLALPTPNIFPGVAHANGNETGENFSLFKKRPTRGEIAGHFVHIDDGDLHDQGRYWSKRVDLRQTADLVADSEDYDHLLFYAHGGLNSIYDSARRIKAMKQVFKDNRIYPFHFMYDTGLLEELKDILLRRHSEGGGKVAGFTDYTDKLLEKSTRPLGRALWREMKLGAKRPFSSNARGGMQTLNVFLDALAESDRPKKIHLAGHSTGAILLAWLIKALPKASENTTIASCSLMAPAATVDLFRKNFSPEIGKLVKQLRIYSLSKELELDDNVAFVYRKSLLYYVSLACEEELGEEIVGMVEHNEQLPQNKDLRIIISKGEDGSEKRSNSESHGGFDNDPTTMNDILKTILGKKPKREFKEDDLDY
ncbi:MAG: C1 family peptidase [gamma proteobacterium endosymbiont of Lamellibrachia anaximandri]|nr:C1 family peptidase [gamma proteobacterium endosymbiont of Lamellibrachia anaximandri]